MVIAINTFGDNKYRANYLQFLTKHYGWKYLREKYGCLAGKNCQGTAREHIRANDGVALWAPKFGRKPTAENKELIVKTFLINNSRLSSQNTTEEVDGVEVPTRHLDDSISELFLKYEIEIDDHLQVSESTFRKLIDKFKIFGCAHQDTDMCRYCMRAVELRKLLTSLYNKHEEYQLFQSMQLELDDVKISDEMKIDSAERIYDIPTLTDGNNTDKYRYPLQNLLNYVHISDEFDVMDEHLWTERITYFHGVTNHRYDKNHVNNQYQSDITKVPDNTVVIVMDFKQNMVIGRSQIEASEAYHQSREPRSVLGYHVATQSTRYFVDYLSDCTSKSSAYAVQCTRHLLNTQWFKTLIETDNISNVIVWSDRGTHFMDKHNLYYWLCELLWDYGWVQSVKYNFFVEKHGKSIVDGHFGLLSYYFKSYCKASKQGVFNTVELQHALSWGHQKALRKKQHRRNVTMEMNVRLNRHWVENRNVDVEMKVVNFDLERNNGFTNVVNAAKADEIHGQHCLKIPDVTKCGSYKVYKNINWELNKINYERMRCDDTLHTNMYHVDDDKYNRYNYDIKTRAEFGLLPGEEGELNKEKFAPYKYQVMVAGQAYYNALWYQNMDCKLGI